MGFEDFQDRYASISQNKKPFRRGDATSAQSRRHHQSPGKSEGEVVAPLFPDFLPGESIMSGRHRDWDVACKVSRTYLH